MSSSSAVQVAVRIRPLNEEEKRDGCQRCVDAVTAKQLVLGGDRGQSFSFDSIIHPRDSQEHVFSQCVEPLMETWLEGYNATCFAYGQTSSGKTHTMIGGTDDERGIIPRVCDRLFRFIAQSDGEEAKFTECTVKCAFLEIYQEHLKDLLQPSSDRPVRVRDNSDGEACVQGLSEHRVHSPDEVFRILDVGNAARSSGSTSMNTHSSRSHAVFTITLEQLRGTADEGEVRISKFHLVDLAGSERQKRSKAEGVRLREAVSINRGLLALGNVINALSSSQRNQKQSKPATDRGHIPYRDSKLTRLLQDSLGGNSRTVMIACISPADVNYDETRNTLKYAQRARAISNAAVINTSPQASELAALRYQVRQLQIALLHHQAQGSTPNATGPFLSDVDSCPSSSSSSSLTDALSRVSQLEQQLATLREEVASAENRASSEADEADRLRSALIAAEQQRDAWRQRYEWMWAVDISDLQLEARADGSHSNTDVVELQQAMQRQRQKMEVMERELNEWREGKREASPSSQEEEFEGSGAMGSADDAQASLARHERGRTELSLLSQALREKEQLLEATNQSDASLGVARAMFDSRVAGMQVRLAHLKREQEAAVQKAREAGAVSQTEARTAQERAQTRQGKIDSMQRKIREVSQLEQVKDRAEARAADLASEIASLKQARDDLQQRLRADAARFRTKSREQAAQVRALQKSDQSQQVALEKLQTQAQKQQAVLRRKTEELVHAQRRLRDQSQPHRKPASKTTRPDKNSKRTAAETKLGQRGAASIEDVSLSADVPLLPTGIATEIFMKTSPAMKKADFPMAAAGCLLGELSVQVALRRAHSLWRELTNARRDAAAAAGQGDADAASQVHDLSQQIQSLRSSMNQWEELQRKGVQVASSSGQRQLGWVELSGANGASARLLRWFMSATAQVIQRAEERDAEWETMTVKEREARQEAEERAAEFQRLRWTAEQQAASAARSAEERLLAVLGVQSQTAGGNAEDDDGDWTGMPSDAELAAAIHNPSEDTSKFAASGDAESSQALLSREAFAETIVKGHQEPTCGSHGAFETLRSEVDRLRYLHSDVQTLEEEKFALQQRVRELENRPVAQTPERQQRKQKANNKKKTKTKAASSSPVHETSFVAWDDVELNDLTSVDMSEGSDEEDDDSDDSDWVGDDAGPPTVRARHRTGRDRPDNGDEEDDGGSKSVRRSRRLRPVRQALTLGSDEMGSKGPPGNRSRPIQAKSTAVGSLKRSRQEASSTNKEEPGGTPRKKQRVDSSSKRPVLSSVSGNNNRQSKGGCKDVL